jgi:membrane protein DedA with SNARE-associated domain
MAAGMSKVPLKKFVVLNFLGGLVWTAFLMSLGYVFGNIYQQVSEGLRIATIVFYLVIFLLAIQGFSRYMRKKINEKNLNL